MGEEEFGLIFKEMRKEKAYKVTSFENQGVSKSMISRFENGKGSLSIGQLYACLTEMNVGLYEYEQFYRKFSLGGYEEFFSKLYRAYYNRDSGKLRKYYKEVHDSTLKIAIKSLFLMLTMKQNGNSTFFFKEIEKDYIIGFLFEVNHWGFYELMILNCTINNLGYQRINLIIQELRAHTERYKNVLHYQRIIIQILTKGALSLILINKKTKSREIIDRTYKLLDEDNLFSRILWKYTDGVWKYKFSDRDEGEKQVYREIEILRELKSKSLADFYQNLFERDFSNIRKTIK